MHVPKGDPEKGLDPFFAKAYFALISPLSSDPWPHSPLIFRALRKITPRWFYIKFRYAYRYLFSCILGFSLRKHGVSVILRGPFAGMKFVSKPVYGCYLPQILGTYEQEISKFLREILSVQKGTMLLVYQEPIPTPRSTLLTLTHIRDMRAMRLQKKTTGKARSFLAISVRIRPSEKSPRVKP